jgi:Glycosyltransferase sugar-binding region containing DXD motif
MNADMEVYLIFFTSDDGVDMKQSDLINALIVYPNINIRYLNPTEFSKGTPLEQFFAENKMQNSSNPIEHLADISRVMLLNRYGGQYLDLDVLSLFPITQINRTNFACPEVKNVITNAVLNLDLKAGKAITDKYMQ